MRQPRLNTGFSTYTDADFELKSKDIYSSLNGNDNFPTPNPPLSVADAAIKGYTDALVAAQTRDRDAVSKKDKAREVLTLTLVQLADSCMSTAKGDKTMLDTTGFVEAKFGNVTVITTPTGISLKNGLNSGELILRSKSVKGARAYKHQYTEDPPTEKSEWVTVTTTASKHTFKGLVPGVRYWCRIAAIGPRSQEAFSDAICRMVI